jgi:hypothetical protein
MRTSAIILTLATLAVGVQQIAAQEGSAPVAANSLVEHAQLGLLEAVGVDNNRIIIALSGRVEPGAENPPYESFDTNALTEVEGLGSIMRVSSALAQYEGNVVVVTYVNRGQHFLAKRIDFTPDRQIHATRGSIVRVDRDARAVVMRNATGVEETIHLSDGEMPAIDSNSGLKHLSDLRPGQQLTVYYGGLHNARLVWLG